MAIILKLADAERDYLLHALAQYAEQLDPAETRAAVLALLLAVVDEETLLLTDRGVFEVALAVLHYAARHGRCAESEAIITKLAPLATAAGRKAE